MNENRIGRKALDRNQLDENWAHKHSYMRAGTFRLDQLFGLMLPTGASV